MGFLSSGEMTDSLRGMKLARNEREVDNIGDCRNKYG